MHIKDGMFRGTTLVPFLALWPLTLAGGIPFRGRLKGSDTLVGSSHRPASLL